MSGASFTEICPKCGGAMYSYSDWKPHNIVGGQCIECGFVYWTERGRMSLEEVNGLRADEELKPLKRRKAWKHK
jgi:Zn ribbon nucleic-acid-binding protein